MTPVSGFPGLVASSTRGGQHRGNHPPSTKEENEVVREDCPGLHSQMVTSNVATPEWTGDSASHDCSRILLYCLGF
ncbi:hypothetical protein LEMLEM_LOCUS12680 [Lemmus lemmus]